MAKPENIFVTPRQIGNFEGFEERFEHFPPMLSGYQPSFYIDTDTKNDHGILHDEKQREFFLVKMMYILMVKRLESSWFSLFSTVGKIRDHHQNTLNKIKTYQTTKADMLFEGNNESSFFEESELETEVLEFTLGKKRKINLSEIDVAGNLNQYKEDLKNDIQALDDLYTNLKRFEEKIKKELKKRNNHKSSDEKLQVLIEKIRNKQKSGINNDNQKLVIFTVYKDTANYLFSQLSARGFRNVAMVSGSGSRTDDSAQETKYFEPILQRFAPYTNRDNNQKYQLVPRGVYTGFKANLDICFDEGIIALLGYPVKPQKVIDHKYLSYDLIYIDMGGNPVLLNQKEVLGALAFHKDKKRVVTQSIDEGEGNSIQALVDAIKIWLNRQAVEEEKQEDGSTKKKMGIEARDLLSKLKSGDSSAVKKMKRNVNIKDKYKVDNFDLITWFLVS